MFDKRLLKNLDYVIIAVVVLLTTISFFVIASASPENPSYFVKRQAARVIVGGLALFVLTLSIDYHDLAQYTRYLYYTNLALLTTVLVLGREAKGAQRWLRVGPVEIQPSELAKLIIIITLADLLSKRASSLHTVRDLLPVFVHVGLPMILILKQPDLGTSLVFMGLLLGDAVCGRDQVAALGRTLRTGRGGCDSSLVLSTGGLSAKTHTGSV